MARRLFISPQQRAIGAGQRASNPAAAVVVVVPLMVVVAPLLFTAPRVRAVRAPLPRLCPHWAIVSNSRDQINKIARK